MMWLSPDWWKEGNVAFILARFLAEQNVHLIWYCPPEFWILGKSFLPKDYKWLSKRLKYIFTKTLSFFNCSLDESSRVCLTLSHLNDIIKYIYLFSFIVTEPLEEVDFTIIIFHFCVTSNMSFWRIAIKLYEAAVTKFISIHFLICLPLHFCNYTSQWKDEEMKLKIFFFLNIYLFPLSHLVYNGHMSLC